MTQLDLQMRIPHHVKPEIWTSARDSWSANLSFTNFYAITHSNLMVGCCGEKRCASRKKREEAEQKQVLNTISRTTGIIVTARMMNYAAHSRKNLRIVLPLDLICDFLLLHE